MATNLERHRVIWDGQPGLPGLSVFYQDTAAGGILSADLVTFFQAIKGLFPPSLSWTIENSGDTISDATGELTGTWSSSGGGTLSGNAVGTNFVRGTGMRVKWRTAGVVHGRRVVGSTFLTGMVSSTWQNDGTPNNADVATVQAAAAALVAAGNLFIWSRPIDAAHATPTVPARTGSSHIATAAQAVDNATSLRSRRV